jgi:hypothetical protein
LTAVEKKTPHRKAMTEAQRKLLEAKESAQQKNKVDRGGKISGFRAEPGKVMPKGRKR